MDDKFERFKNGTNKLIKENLVRVMTEIAVTPFSEDSELQMLGGCATTREKYQIYIP